MKILSIGLVWQTHLVIPNIMFSPQAPHYVVREDDENFFTFDNSKDYPSAAYMEKKKVKKTDTSDVHYPICQIPPEKL